MALLLAGHMRLILAGHDITMGPGEVAEFDTRLPHWFGPAADQPVEIPQPVRQASERIHVRAAPRARSTTRDNGQTTAASPRSPQSSRARYVPNLHP